MKITIFGATGHTGRLLVQDALKAGHQVTAFARDPSAITFQHRELSVHQGDVLDQTTVEPAIRNQDAVLIALGSPKGGPKDLCSRGTQNIVGAMQRTGVRRVICLSAMGAGDSRPYSGLFGRVIAPLFMKDWLADKERQEEILTESGLDWTLVRPPRLTDEPGSNNYRTGTNISGGLSAKASFADVATFMLRQITEDTYLQRSASILS